MSINIPRRAGSVAGALQRRPRLDGAREAEIFEATAELLARYGYDKLTFDQVASATRSSKATLYRRWPGKDDLVLDALRNAQCFAGPTQTDTGSLRGDLLAMGCGPGGLTRVEPISIIAAVVPAMQRDPALFARFREQLIAPKTAVMVGLLQRAAARGEIGPDADLELLAQILPAICIHHSVVLGHDVTTDLIEQILDSIVLPACRATTAPETTTET